MNIPESLNEYRNIEQMYNSYLSKIRFSMECFTAGFL